MEPNPTDQPIIQESPSTPNRVRIAIILCILLFFTVIITLTILNPLLHHSSIAPVSSDVSSSLSAKDLLSIESSVKSHLSFTYDLSSDDLDSLSIVIRENTLETKRDDSNSITLANFIIDLSSPQLTYKVTYQPSSNLILLTCPTINLVQDSSIFCIGTDNHSTIDANLDQYLPYEGTTANDIDYSISHQSGDSISDPYLTIYASVCDDEADAIEVETAVKDWIHSKGIPDPDIIPLHFSHSYCNERD